MMTGLLAAIICFYLWLRFNRPDSRYWRRGWRSEATEKPCLYRTRRKPCWVSAEIVRIKAMQPHLSCRDISNIFNRLHAATRNMTVGKTYVSEIIKRHAYEIAAVRRRMRGRKNKPGPKNRIWGVDLTGKAAVGWQYSILGIVDHGTRLNLRLDALPDKRSLTLLFAIARACLRYGRPKVIRTDNEAIFTSRRFRFGLALLGIRHQTTELHCPWMNGRIERFFGTLKQKLDHWKVPDRKALDTSLAEFRFWYNAVRPHQSLYGRTPAEVWCGHDIYRQAPKAAYRFDAWDGLLSGVYLLT